MNIRKNISKTTAANSIIASCFLIICYHLLIVSGFISYKYVWGGRLENVQQMYTFEAISLFINSLLIFLTMIQMQYIKPYIPIKIAQRILLFLCILLCFNTVGNLFSVSVVEKVVFTPVTAILAILIYRLIIK